MPASVGLRWGQAYFTRRTSDYLPYNTALAYPAIGVMPYEKLWAPNAWEMGDDQEAPHGLRGSAADGKLSEEESIVG